MQVHYKLIVFRNDPDERYMIAVGDGEFTEPLLNGLRNLSLLEFFKGYVGLEQVAHNPREGSAQAKAWFAGRQLLRFLALLVIIYLLVRHGWVNIFGLLVGLSTVVLTLMLAAINEVIKLKNKEANPSHGTSHSIS